MFDRQTGKQNLGVADVIVVAESARRIDVLGRYEIGRFVAAVIQHIGHKKALPQQVRATRQIKQEGRGSLMPPGHVVVEMRARRKHLSGLAGDWA